MSRLLQRPNRSKEAETHQSPRHPPARHFAAASIFTRRASVFAVTSGTYIAVTFAGSARKSPGVVARRRNRISHFPAGT